MTCDKRWTEFARGFVEQSEVGNLRGPDGTLINATDKVMLWGIFFSGSPDECAAVSDVLAAALGEMFEKLLGAYGPVELTADGMNELVMYMISQREKAADARTT